ncbi:fumarylacetoacetate hydrolase family protein [Nitrospinota bacterium]
MGALLGEDVVDLPLLAARLRTGEAFPSTMIGLIAQWGRLQPIVEDLLGCAAALKTEGGHGELFIPEAGVNYLPPIPHPPKNINAQGVNYKEHGNEGLEAKTLSRKEPIYTEHPVLFSKPHTGLVGHRGGIIHHRATNFLDYEGELCVVIGKPGRNIPPEKVYEHVFGYCVGNDVPARDRQRMHKGAKGKSMDTHCPMGPFLVPKDYFGDPMNVMLRTWVNGELRQESSTSQMIHDVKALVSVLSLGTTLEIGEILMTGTPSGVGYARENAESLKAGDVVEIEIEGLGRLRNTVVAPPD